MPTIKEFLLSELNREVQRSRKALEQMPEGKGDWKRAAPWCKRVHVIT